MNLRAVSWKPLLSRWPLSTRALVLAILLTGGLAPLQAQPITNWTGSVSTDYNNPSNWDNGLPTGPGITYIDLGTGNVCTVDNVGTGTGVLFVGNSTAGPANSFTIQTDASITTNGSEIGNGPGSSGIVTVMGNWDLLNNPLVVANQGNGTLNITSGGNVSDASNVSIGFNSGSFGSVTVDGAGSIWDAGAGNLAVGSVYGGNGVLTIANGGKVVISNGQQLDLQSDGSSNGTLNLNAGGTLEIGTTGSVNSTSGNATFSFNGGTIRAGGDFAIAANLALNANSSIDSNGHNVAVNAVISGTGNLTKTGSGAVALNANSTYATTTISGGSLVVNAVLTSNVTVAGGVLGGGGQINGNVTVNSGGVSPGIANAVTGNQAAAFTALAINGNLALNVTTATFVWHLNHDSFLATSDELDVVGNLTTGSQVSSTITFDFQGTGYFDGVHPVTYTLITAANDLSTAGFTFAAVNLDADAPAWAVAGSHFLYANGGTTLEYVLVPEPAAWSLLLGATALLLGLWRRRTAQ